MVQPGNRHKRRFGFTRHDCICRRERCRAYGERGVETTGKSRRVTAVEQAKALFRRSAHEFDVRAAMVARENLRVALMRIDHSAALRQITFKKLVIKRAEAFGAERMPAGKTVTGECLAGVDLRAHESACLGATTAQARCV